MEATPSVKTGGARRSKTRPKKTCRSWWNGDCFNLKKGIALNRETVDMGSLFVELIVAGVPR
jgi:hypothetical protein